jgi:hypothetical protein
VLLRLKSTAGDGTILSSASPMWFRYQSNPANVSVDGVLTTSTNAASFCSDCAEVVINYELLSYRRLSSSRFRFIVIQLFDRLIF